MDRTADLDSALSFVIGRIEQEAKLSGDPLHEQQRLLLNYLPSSPPVSSYPDAQVPVPRNINLERVYELGKAAYLRDRQANPTSLDWEFAFSVLRLNRHPMGGLLQLVGMKPQRPQWDGLLLIATALMPIVAVILVVWKADGPMFQSIGIALVCAAIMLWLFFNSRRIEKQRLQEHIERCRLASRKASNSW